MKNIYTVVINISDGKHICAYVMYTIIGGFIGFTSALFVNAFCGNSYKPKSRYFPSEGLLVTIGLTILGSAAGFGFGAAKFASGDHMIL